MSDDTNPEAEFLIRTRDLIAEGKSAYGPVGSPKQIEKLAEYNAKLDFGRRTGEVPPAPEPMNADRIAKERLASEWRNGEPSLTVSEHHADFFNKQLDALAELPPQVLAIREREVVDDLEQRPSPVCAPHCGYRAELNRRATGFEVREGLLKDAEAVIAANHPDPADRARVTKLIRGNRQLLEHYAHRGQARAAYAAQKKKYGL